MAAEYNRGVLRLVVAQICQTIGWHSINSTPLEFMVDLMQEYFMRVSKLTHQYAEVLGRTETNLDDMGLAFQHMNIDIQELAEYVKNVDSVPCVINVPKFPIHRDNHLNFLKPGSREVVTRPVHIHEYLPAMFPDTEEEYTSEKTGEGLTNGTSDSGSSNGTLNGNPVNVSPQRISPQVVFKRPGDPVSFESPITKRAKIMEEGRPLREIHSVMMTTSGFLSPAREGKLPEARTPQQARSDSPPSSSYPMVPPELKCDKKPKKVVKKGSEDRKLDKENKKKNRVKELFKPDKVVDDSKVKKLASMKELAKLKPLKPGGGKVQGTMAGSSSRPTTPKLIPPKTIESPKLLKNSQSKIKAEKVIDLTSSPPLPDRKEDNVDKLPSEPDKQKLNIFKKISKPREDKEKEIPEQHTYKDLDSRESSPGLIIDENIDKHAHRNNIDTKREEKKTPHTPDVRIQPDGDLTDLQSPSSDVYMFEDMSPPGTPSTPKTPELNVPALIDQKKKRKEKGSKRKESKLKSPKHCVSPKKMKISNDLLESDIPDRPKTPQAPEPSLHREPNLPPTLPFPFFPTFSPAPGLIPHPIGHPMFPRFPLPLGRGGPGPHPAMPNLPLPPRFLNSNPKPEDFSLSKIKSLDRDKSSPSLPTAMVPPLVKPEKLEKEKSDKIGKMLKQEKEISIQNTALAVVSPTAPTTAPLSHSPHAVSTPTPIASSLPPKSPKIEKADKNDKKSKEHKKEKKDKLKKKKDKKEKHKEKGEKLKDRKEKGDRKEKMEKVKDKKDKKEKRKEKEKEEKATEGVPKITLKLGPASPRPPTPDNVPMKKITIKPLVKKPEEEVKREPSPELAKISALVTRPPKQKSASKKQEEGALDANPILPSDTSFSSNLTSVSLSTASRAKKAIFKALPLKEPTPPHHFDPPPKPSSPPLPQQQAAFYFVKADAVTKKDDAKEDKENGGQALAVAPTTTVDQGGRQVWICPACGNQDDGSPMIGCDDCDAWYHWVCVGMQVPPAINEDWYCRLCIAKKQELHHDKKKKKRKKKVKVTA